MKQQRITDEQFDEAVKVYATSKADEGIVTAKLNAAVKKASDPFNDKLKDLANKSSSAAALIEQYCNQNKVRFEGSDRSIKTGGLTIGFRTTPFAVVIPDGIKAEDIISMLKKKRLDSYIATEEKLDKKALVDNRADPKLIKALETLDVEIAQGEKFYINPLKV